MSLVVDLPRLLKKIRTCEGSDGVAATSGVEVGTLMNGLGVGACCILLSTGFTLISFVEHTMNTKLLNAAMKSLDLPFSRTDPA